MNPAHTIQDQPVWRPDPEKVMQTAMGRFMHAHGCASYEELWSWSIQSPEQFWPNVVALCRLIGHWQGPVLENAHAMPGARWFPQAQLNYAENLLRDDMPDSDITPAVIFWGENKVKRHISRASLRADVAKAAAVFRAAGIGQGDRVAGYLPNLPETLTAMLAAVSLGAIWCSASPDFGVDGVLDRFGQTQPKALICTDGYWYNGKWIDCRSKNEAVARQLSGLKLVLEVAYPCADEAQNSAPSAMRSWHEELAQQPAQELVFTPLPFAHPLFIMFSSGTTGQPKCIVHGHGVILQHAKEHVLHCDLQPGDRLFYFTTCGWMMWNWLASGLASGATLMLYDGSPFAAGHTVLFDYAQEERITHFGTSAKFLDASEKFGLEPIRTHHLPALRAILSTGSPLVAERFDYVYNKIKNNLLLASISGGTDLLSCFVLGNPLLPVFRGEIQCRGLGMHSEVINEAREPVIGEKGELVCLSPFPSMPTGFWQDHDGSKYRAAYFERFPGLWCHGDYAEITPHGGFIIHGRSDSTLNPGGVRIGTSEIYRQVEKLPEIMESIVVGQQWDRDVRVVLFVRLREGIQLDDALRKRISQQIRDNTTPRHVPAVILQVEDIPRTKSGKIVELAVRDVIHGHPVLNKEALANPESLAYYQQRPELSV